MERVDETYLTAVVAEGGRRGCEQLVLGVMLIPAQGDYFSSLTELGVDRQWLNDTLRVVQPVFKAVASDIRKVVRRRCRIEEKLFTSAHFVALLLVASSSLRTAEDSRRPLTAALQETLKKTGVGAADKLANALALFADLAPLGCSSAEYANDKLLQAVATSKSREVKQVFHFAVIRELPHDVGELTFQFVMPRKAPFFRQRDAAEEVQVKGIVKQSRRGAEVTIGTTGGEKAITATVPHDDGTLAALVHAASLGGTVDFLLERTVLECEAAPQLKRVVCSIKEVKPGKDMLCYLQSLRQAVQRFMDELASEDPDQAA